VVSYVTEQCAYLIARLLMLGSAEVALTLSLTAVFGTI